MTRPARTTAKPRASEDARRPTQANTKKIIKVNLALQIVEAYEGDERVFRFECVSGDKDHPTDRGRFRIIDKAKKYRSNAYNVQMNYALFFTEDRKALHQYHGFVPLSLLRSARGASDWFGSHGCVRLTEADAKALFEWTPKHTEVHVS